MYQYRDEIRRIMISVNVIEGICETMAKKAGMKINTLTLFYALDDGKAHSQKEICEKWLIPKTTLNTIVKECIGERYIYLNADKGKKEKTICLTPKGREYAEKILNRIYEVEEHAMECTLETASLEFVPTLEQFAVNLKQEEEKETISNEG